MHRIIKNTILQYIPQEFSVENTTNPARIFELNQNEIKKGNIVYLCEREIRTKDNFALQFANQLVNAYNFSLKIIHPKILYKHKPKNIFIEKQIEQVKRQFQYANYDFEIFADDDILGYLKNLNTAILIVDFNPILARKYLQNATFKLYEIDSHNIVPARFVSDKQEYNAATMRRKLYFNIYNFLTDYKNNYTPKMEADFVLDDFIRNKLPYYAQYKNNPEYNVLSGLSKYINLGFISSQRIALEVIKSAVSDDNKEVFLEELIVRKELADNFCLYANYSNFSGTPIWAQHSLKQHRYDLRPYIYSKQDLENSNTNDKLWNATQTQLKQEGIIHGYLRMYWAKKILEWTHSPADALKIAYYLNDKYAYDAPSPNGYVGILWAIGALHDRAFVDMPVTGKIRRMTFNSIKRKFDLEKYIQKYSTKK